MNLLDSVYYYHAEHGCWKPSFIISFLPKKERIVVAGYGPHLPNSKVLLEDEYIRLVDTETLDSYTNDVKETK